MSSTAIISIVNDCLNFGQFAYGGVPTQFKNVVTFGAHLKDLVELEKTPDSVMVKLNELERNMELLSREMDGILNELKADIADFHFYEEMAQTASTLTNFLQDVISAQSHHAVGIFHDACVRNPPLQYACKLICLVKKETSNPLRISTNSDKWKNKETVEKWRNFIDGVLNQFLFLECMVNGMFWQSNMYGPNQLKEKIEQVNRQMDSWSDALSTLNNFN